MLLRMPSFQPSGVWLMRRLRIPWLLLPLMGTTNGMAQVVWPSDIEHVRSGLRSQASADRRHASERLSALPPSVIADLVLVGLKDSDPTVRLNAAKVAARHSVPRSGALTISWLSDPVSEVRLAGVSVLQADPTPESADALGRALSDTDSNVRLAAVGALGALGGREAATVILGHLEDPETRVRVAVFRQLANLGDVRSVVPLLGKASDLDADVRTEVLRTLGTLKDVRSLSVLLAALKDKEESPRLAALWALGQLADQSAVPAIALVLRELPRDLEQQAALTALENIGGNDSVDAAVAVLTSRHPAAAWMSAREALVRMGATTSTALKQCLASINEVELADRCLSAWSEARPVQAASEALAQLPSGLVSKPAALSALGAAREPRFLTAALAGLVDEDPATRAAARHASATLLSATPSRTLAVDPIGEALDRFRGERPALLEHIALLGLTGAERASQLLLPFAATGNPAEVRLAAVAALGRLAPGKYDRVLLELVDDDDARVAGEAALSLRRVGRAELLPLIYEKLRNTGGVSRQALLAALFGPMSRSYRAAPIEVGAALMRRAHGAERDAWLEALGAAGLPVSLEHLRSWVGGNFDAADRRKVSETFGAVAQAQPLLTELLQDPDGSVRAAAAWAFGARAGHEGARRLHVLLKDIDLDVVINASAALARIARRTPGTETTTLCALLEHHHPYVRSNALAGLQSADLCAGIDRASVRREARLPASTPTPPRREALSVFIVPVGSSRPEPGTNFALRYADGLIRAGTADRRGVAFDQLAPAGAVKLLVPGHLVW